MPETATAKSVPPPVSVTSEPPALRAVTRVIWFFQSRFEGNPPVAGDNVNVAGVVDALSSVTPVAAVNAGGVFASLRPTIKSPRY